jgi:hypothetical protein
MLNAQRTALALTATTAILYVVCSIGYAVIPGLAVSLSQAVFHGMLVAPVMNFGSFLIGLVTICVIAYITGAMFVWCYNAGARARV